MLVTMKRLGKEEKEMEMSKPKLFKIPEKFLTPETRTGDILEAITGKIAFIFRAKREDHAIGFHAQGSGPFIRYCRYSYPKNVDFKIAFSCQESSSPLQAHLLNEVDVYPEGIIAVRQFSGSEKIFVADDLPNAGIKITREEFDKTHFALKKMAM